MKFNTNNSVNTEGAAPCGITCTSCLHHVVGCCTFVTFALFRYINHYAVCMFDVCYQGNCTFCHNVLAFLEISSSNLALAT